ncbi:right-handed parallel beta-helix repeat-containing protein [Paenibacillus sp. YYML68]|uniref:right-handed parallel beta-helix repeat-containing protein n=1 Tax=Paenibacillus sp. YYML68 TaxID=2909250 RepID=UPI0024923D76|nr:right-handed parallel beta-helix repeat-containing protein [Paenibacillus sp. YYML68]
MKLKSYWVVLFMLALVFSTIQAPQAAHAATRNVYVDTVTEIKDALKNALPGDVILVAPGEYHLTTTTTVGDKKAYYYSTKSGNSTDKITIKSQFASNPATLKGGNVASEGYTLYITGNYWVIQDIKIKNGQKGIILDNSNNTRINKVTVSDVGQEGIHVRDGSKNTIIENSTIKNTGVTGTANDKGFAEGIYVGSDRSVWDVNSSTGYDRNVSNTKIRNNTIGPNVAAESIDIKEGASGTLVEGNTFLGAGISGENYADSFIDVKGYNTTIRNNVFYRQNNSKITKDIAEVDRTNSSNPWCPANETSNKDLDDTSDGNTYTNNTFHQGNP